LANKYKYKRLDDVARQNYVEMGLLFLNFVLTKNKKGVWGIELYMMCLVECKID